MILMGGKPYAIPEIAEKAQAILNTFYLGQANGLAVSKVLFGEVNPSGKLPEAKIALKLQMVSGEAASK